MAIDKLVYAPWVRDEAFDRRRIHASEEVEDASWIALQLRSCYHPCTHSGRSGGMGMRSEMIIECVSLGLDATITVALDGTLSEPLRGECGTCPPASVTKQRSVSVFRVD